MLGVVHLPAVTEPYFVCSKGVACSAAVEHLKFFAWCQEMGAQVLHVSMQCLLYMQCFLQAAVGQAQRVWQHSTHSVQNSEPYQMT